MKKICIGLLLISLLIGGYLCPSWISSARATSGSTIYTTWENMEIDKCASAWLIKRFIDKNASFKFVPKGTLITEGIPFDVPEAEIRRYHNISAFEYLIKKHKINDPALKKLGKIIHDIEINYWGNKNFTESQKIADTVQETIRTSETAEETFRKCFILFDNLYSEFNSDNSGGK